MQIERIITSVNMNPQYLTFAPFFSMAWEKVYGIKPTIALIKENNSFVNHITRDYLRDCDVIEFDRIEGVDSGIQSKITRMYLASCLEGNNMIADVDMISLSADFIRSYKSVPDDHLAKFGGEHVSFQKAPDIGKWPMHGTAASQKTFKEIVNPRNLDYSQLVVSWTGYPQDPRSNVFNNFNMFSDESLMKCLFDFWEHKETRVANISRNEVGSNYTGGSVLGRLCRSENCNDIPKEELHRYYECHGPRPFHEYIDFYNNLLTKIQSLEYNNSKEQYV